MADGSHEDRSDLKRLKDLTFSAAYLEHGDRNKCSAVNSNDNKVKLSFYTELETSESCEKSESRGVAANCNSAAVGSARPQKYVEHSSDDGEEIKKRCFDRYDSSESSDSGVVVLSPSESSACSGSGSDVTSPRSPRSPASSCGAPDETRMPPWTSEPAPAGPRRAAPTAPAAPVAPVTPATPRRRRISEYFNHKMKPHNGLKRDLAAINDHNDPKRKCLPRNGVAQDLQKYISYLSQTLSPRVLQDVDRQMADATRKQACNGTLDAGKHNVSSVNAASTNGFVDYGKARELGKDRVAHANRLLGEFRQHGTQAPKEKVVTLCVNGEVDVKKQCLYNGKKQTLDPSANGMFSTSKQGSDCWNKKVPIPSKNLVGLRLAPASQINKEIGKVDSSKMNGVASIKTKLDSKMNGVTCGSNNLNLNPITPKTALKKDQQKRATTGAAKRTNRKSSGCIANSKNITWSKANNLKQVQLQSQHCVNSLANSHMKNISNDTNSMSQTNIPNGIRPLPMAMNGNINSLNVQNLQNCHQINIPTACNGTVTSTNLASFVAVPQNVMLTTLRIPQNGIAAQTVNQQNSMNAFNHTNVNVNSPTKLNGQFVFPFVQNLNGTVVQIPNLMAKVAPNYVLPQSPQISTSRQDHIQTQQAAQILINGTLLKLANTMSSGCYPNLTTKPVTATSMSMPPINKPLPGMPSVGMTVQSKTNYTVNMSSHPLFVPQSGFIVNSVPNITVKETWSNINMSTVMTNHNITACGNPIIQHQSINTSISSQMSHSCSSIRIPPVKPPDKPNLLFDPPVTHLKPTESDVHLKGTKCDIPWLSKTVNNNNVHLDHNKVASRPFAQVCNLTEKLPGFTGAAQAKHKNLDLEFNEISSRMDKTSEELRRVEAVARREDTIFTQITVLKDVSSNVHNTVIETDFSSATNESSESGIGTDKSIDSPSDSQTSKECDEDSSLSLSISVCSADLSCSQKSPILKQPKTLRFPPKNMSKLNSDKRASSTDTSSSVTVCLWENCNQEFESDTDLLEHLQMRHVESQAGRENYVCLWSRCKVRGKPSCSRLWLERHALSHGGNKPFKCIVDGCGRRFSTQILLERHVNNHFNEQSPNSGSAKKTTDSAPKLIRRNGKKLRYRRQPWSARMFDFFDAGMMEGLAWRLSRGTRWRLGGACPLREPVGRHTITLHASPAATRLDPLNQRREVLLTYYPPHVLEDEWVPEKDVRRVRRVEISSLPTHTKVMLYDRFCASYRGASPPPPSSPPPSPPTPPLPPAPAPAPLRRLPLRHCTSSRLLNTLIAKQRRDECPATTPAPPPAPAPAPAPVPAAAPVPATAARAPPTGAAKRKQGRRHGGNAFWPCGR